MYSLLQSAKPIPIPMHSDMYILLGVDMVTYLQTN